MRSVDIRKEARSIWKAGFLDARRPNIYDTNFDKTLAASEREAERSARASLQPWLHILEDSIQWLANLTAILDRMNAEQRLDSSGQAIWVMVGASCAHAVAVRRLVLSGLDTSARAEARVLDEHLCACIAFLHDRELGARFQQCEGGEQAAQFWYANLNTKVLSRHLNAVERAVGLKQNITIDMRSWRTDEISSFSQAIHPSYTGAAMATLTCSAADHQVYGHAFLGMASACSERTLNFACKSIWYFTCFGFMMLFNHHNKNEPVIPLDKEDEMQQIAVIGRYAIQQMNRKYWSYEIYPPEA